MKNIFLATAIILAASITINAAAQTKINNKVNNAVNKVNQTKATLDNAGATIATTKQTIEDAKTILGDIFGNDKKKKDSMKEEAAAASASPQVIIIINDIEYEDENLSLLKENIGKANGVKKVTKDFESGIATLKIVYGGTSSELWDSLPKESRTSFKLVKSGDNMITLSLKKANQNSEATAVSQN